MKMKTQTSTMTTVCFSSILLNIFNDFVHTQTDCNKIRWVHLSDKNVQILRCPAHIAIEYIVLRNGIFLNFYLIYI